jgi:hypothetical protein
MESILAMTNPDAEQTGTSAQMLELATKVEQCLLYKDVPGLGVFRMREADQKLIVAALRTAALAAPQPQAGASEPVAWKVRVREGSKTYSAYTERLPFSPDDFSGVVAIGEPIPLYATPSPTAARGPD